MIFKIFPIPLLSSCRRVVFYTIQVVYVRCNFFFLRRIFFSLSSLLLEACVFWPVVLHKVPLVSPSLTPPLWERVLPFSMAGLSHVVPHFLQCGVMAFPRFLSFSPRLPWLSITHTYHTCSVRIAHRRQYYWSHHLCDSYQEAKENPPYRESHESKFHAKSRNTKGTITLYSMSPRITVVLLPCV